ncbi:hypothetical protein HO133_010508 [Letharia lupina]|uniref:Cupin type-2 domain-containing protein n=1 Tax=Letharia lupina TaxID=560253 RepID=A0A8H6CI52_9LECA|nr:uncharacterized protein HO133_010508 [Letharia lupina]KAF6223934.1 hypothetical protein HO133_010508 [Letharia lupina]
MSDPRPRNDTQLSQGLPGLTHHITGHDASGLAIVESDRPATWTPRINDTMAFDVVYTTSTFPPNMNGNADLTAHDKLIQSDELGLVNPNGTVARMVDFGPGTEALMHRTQSLDYGIVIEGEVEMILDDGVKRIMRRGDVAVQRGTNHGWRNVSSTEWARMFFVLQDAQKIKIGDKELGADFSNAGSDTEGLAGGQDVGSKL